MTRHFLLSELSLPRKSFIKILIYGPKYGGKNCVSTFVCVPISLEH